MKNTFRLKQFIFLQLVAALLVASWLIPSTRLYWDKLDSAAFFYFNGLLAGPHWAQVFWATTNNRLFDLIPFFILISPVIFADFVFPKAELKQKFLILIGIYIITTFLQTHVFAIRRDSPTYLLQPAYMLRDLVPFIPAKDASHVSFPGDHASVIFTWLAFIFLNAPKKFWAAATAIGIAFCIPRLVAGEHWLSDDLVGGISIVFIAVAWYYYTPIGYYWLKYTSPVFNWGLKWVPKPIMKLTFDRGN